MIFTLYAHRRSREVAELVRRLAMALVPLVDGRGVLLVGPRQLQAATDNGVARAALPEEEPPDGVG